MLLLTLAGCGGTPRPPNVLLFTLDTVRADAIGAYGGTHVATPHLDRLAAEGTRYTRAYTVTPLTIPAHSSMMTGLYPPRHGVRDNGDFFLAPEAVTLAERLKGAGYRTAASVGAEVTSHHWGFAQGFDAFFDELGPAEADGNRWQVERSAAAVNTDALGWLQKQPADGAPWFLWLHYYDAHHPYEAPEPYRSATPNRPYLAEVGWVDSQVGAVVEAVRARGEIEETWIVVVSDHGEGLGSHGESLHGVLLYDATTHIPFIVRVPGRGAAVVDTPVSLVDLAPTILNGAGIAGPFDFDGIDVLGASPPDRAVYAESLYAFRHYGWAEQRALVTNDRKLIDSTTPEMYAKNDRGERNDLAEGDPSGLTALRSRLTTFTSAMVPMSGVSSAAADDAERTAQLEALGYVTADAPVVSGAVLPDPVERLPVLGKVQGARGLLQSGDLDAARIALEAVIAEEPGLGEPRMMLASVLQRSGRIPEAIAVVTALHAARPSSQVKAMLGTLQLQSGDRTAGVATLRAAIELDPYLANVWAPYLHALFLDSSPEFPAEAERALERLPDSARIQGLAGVARAMSRAYNAAEPLLVKAIAAEPKQAFVHHALGAALQSRGDVAGAESAFREETRLYPPAIPSRRELVALFATQRRYLEQLDQLDAIALVEPPAADTLHSIAQVQFNLGRYPEAAAMVARCITLAPRYPGCAMLEANVLKKLGREEEAQAAYRRALDLSGR